MAWVTAGLGVVPEVRRISSGRGISLTGFVSWIRGSIQHCILSQGIELLKRHEHSLWRILSQAFFHPLLED